MSQTSDSQPVGAAARKTSILVVGLDPAVVDFAAMPGLTPEFVRAALDAHIEALCGMGYDAHGCWVDLGETADEVLAAALQTRVFDAVVIGGGLRKPPEQLLLFERLLNLIHALAPEARLAFNTTPADTAEAVRRWVKP